MNHQIVIVAPYPDERFVSEGWMSRIRAIDRVFASVPRAYVNFGAHHRKDHDGNAVPCREGVCQYNLNADIEVHQLIFEDLLHQAKFVYVHTVHLAINVRQWLSSGKIIVDIHGIVPEEEMMLGRPDRAALFSPVEQEVLLKCRHLVTVTESMQRHLLKKYPASKARFITVPIFEDYRRERKKINGSADKARLKVLYAGGSQVWQNVDLMMQMAKRLHQHVDFTFLSHDKKIFTEKAEQLHIDQHITIRSATKEELPAIYADHDFGFALRDESPVNNVSCPTKLSEYMDFGIIPIVKYAMLGDFEQYGYCFLTEEDFNTLLLPDAACRGYMIDENYGAIQKLINEFRHGSQKLLKLLN